MYSTWNEQSPLTPQRYHRFVCTLSFEQFVRRDCEMRVLAPWRHCIQTTTISVSLVLDMDTWSGRRNDELITEFVCDVGLVSECLSLFAMRRAHTSGDGPSGTYQQRLPFCFGKTVRAKRITMGAGVPKMRVSTLLTVELVLPAARTNRKEQTLEFVLCTNTTNRKANPRP